MKILVVSSSFYPQNSPRAFRTTELVKELSLQGNEVTLLGFYEPKYHDDLIKKYGFKIIDLGRLKFKLIQLTNVKILNLFIRILNRLLNLFFEYPDIEVYSKVKSKIKNLSGFDLMISIAAPHPVHWAIASVRSDKKLIAKTWIADCGDPFMGNRMDTFNKIFYFKHFEKKFCSKADYITVPIKNAVTAYYPEFREKIKVIPQGFKFERTKELMKEYIVNDVPTFCYAGSLSPTMRSASIFRLLNNIRY